MENDTLEVTFENPLGRGSLSGQQAQSSSLGRVFRRLFRTGKPVGKTNCVFFEPPVGPMRTLGALCYTPGKQALFFPGINTRGVSWFTRPGQSNRLTMKPGQFLDHITLESDLSRWHATLLTEGQVKETRIPKRRTRQIKRDLIFWFALSVKEPGVLELTPKELHLQAGPVSPSYSKEMADLFIEARENVVFPITSLPDNETFSIAEFLTFEFHIDSSRVVTAYEELTREVRSAPDTEMVLPLTPPAVHSPLPTHESVSYRSHDFSLPSFGGCFVISVYKMLGKLADEAIFSGY